MGAARMVALEVADEDVDRDRAEFGPGVHRQVRLGEQDDAGDSGLRRAERRRDRREVVKQFAHRLQAGVLRCRQAQPAQRVRLRQQRLRRRAAAQVGSEVQAVHRCDYRDTGHP